MLPLILAGSAVAVTGWWLLTPHDTSPPVPPPKAGEPLATTIHRAVQTARAGVQAAARTVTMGDYDNRALAAVSATQPAWAEVHASAGGHAITYRVSADYLGAVAETVFVRYPLKPALAQRAVDTLTGGAVLPTRKMVDQIHAAAVKLPFHAHAAPRETWAAILDHNRSIAADVARLRVAPGTLVSGHMKDIIASRHRLPGKVSIYGGHTADGALVQPPYFNHGDFYYDYSHGTRLVSPVATVDGRPMRVIDVLSHPSLHVLLSDEGPIAQPRYPV